MEPKVSIVIPVYNGENYLREAIDSALRQTYENCEVIVVNDGSTDNTEEIAKEYGNKIRFFSKENGGVSSALNIGIQNMSGEYFSWLSHDDIYYPNKIYKQIKALKQFGDMKAPLYGEADRLLMPERVVKKPVPEYNFTLEERQKGIFPVLFGLVNGCTVLIHKNHFERVGLFKEGLKTAQDIDMWFRIFRNQSVVYIADSLIQYRYHEEQGSKLIEEFCANCQDMQMSMIKKLTVDEINGIFGGHYKFYFDMMRVAVKNNWRDNLKKIYTLFLKTEEPISSQRNCVNDRSAFNRLILYCAGRNGIYLKECLEMWNISVDYFSDNNSKLWGKMIVNVPCIPPNKLKKDDCIVVTKDYPEDIVLNLKKEGYIHVVSYADIARKLFLSMPEKKTIEEYVKRRLKI